ncbi:hypothetical protein BDQ12DRAFT_678344, partial [Crucibulum laeve]
MNVVARTLTNPTALKEGLRIVKTVVATNPSSSGLTTAEIYKLAIQQRPSASFQPWSVPPPPSKITYGKGGDQRIDGPLPPHLEHPIRSMAYLKNTVLPVLEGNVIQKVEMARKKGATSTTSVWKWKAVDKSTLPKPRIPQPPKKIFGSEVGVGEDWSHLNKRRRRARYGKVRRDVEALKAHALVMAKVNRRKARVQKIEDMKETRKQRRILLERKEAARIRTSTTEEAKQSSWSERVKGLAAKAKGLL